MTKEPFIVYIDDERPALELISQALKLVGYEVTGVISSEQGLALMRGRKPDLLLLDLMMPHVSGWDVYRTMKTDEALADIPVIVITGQVPAHNRVIIEGLPPVDDYITKPFDVKRLIRSIQKFLPIH
jgi:two-component system phosphate regulon response regulator PhoB